MSKPKPLSAEDAVTAANLGRALSEAVESSNVSQTAICKAAGISRMSLFRMMSGTAVPPQSALLSKVGRALGVKPGHLLDGEVVRDPNAQPPPGTPDLVMREFLADLHSVRARQSHFVTRQEFHDGLAEANSLIERLSAQLALVEKRLDAVERLVAPRPRSRGSAKKAE